MTILDVSYAQGDIDWSQVFTPDIEGVIIRASHGGSTDGSRWPTNASRARHFADVAPHKPWIGYYHFAEYRPGERPFASVIGTLAQYPPDYYMLDAETPCPLSGPALTNWVREGLSYADGLPRRRQCLTWLYSFESFFHEHFGLTFSNRPAWVAKVGDGSGSPGHTPPNVGYPYAAWQFSWTEHHPGIAGNVDASHVGPAFPGGAVLPTNGGFAVPKPIKTVVDPESSWVVAGVTKKGSAWTLQDDGGILTEHGQVFHGAWGSLPAKTRENARVERFYDLTLRFDGKPGYTIWVLSKTGATLDYNFPLGS